VEVVDTYLGVVGLVVLGVVVVGGAAFLLWRHHRHAEAV
jgi:hypothetical protein